jgi:hypothetical protein
LNGLDNLSTRPRIRLVKKDFGARRETDIVKCRYPGARSWGKGFVSTFTIRRGGFKKREVVKFVIGVRVASRPTAWATCAAGATGVKPEGAAVKVSDGTPGFAICDCQIPLACEVLYLFIAGSKGLLCFLKSMFEDAVPLCELRCV